MDKHNLFFTRANYNLVRAEQLVMLLGVIGLVVAHWDEVRWLHFTLAFLWSDLIGTFPGMYWHYKRTTAENRKIPAAFYALYNFCHSFLSVAAVTAAWYALTGRFEWAMLAMPIHLLGDRAIFGNIYKTTGLEFEPAPNPMFRRFVEQFRTQEGQA